MSTNPVPIATHQPGDRLIFPNVPVQDPARSRAFFEAIGFTFNDAFCNEDAVCMVVSDKAYVMMLKRAFFQSFSKRDTLDPQQQTGVYLAISCANRQAVDDLIEAALANGATEAMEPQDHGFMYGRSFYDLDGNHWEPNWLDPAAINQPPTDAN